MHIKFLRKPACMESIGIRASSTLYLRIEQGLVTPPVHLGPRSVGWPQHELQAINAARLAGKSDADVRKLVAELVEARKSVEAA